MEETIHCPYNFAHVVLKHRMAAHLIKCRKQHSFNNEFSTCPFNSTHDVPTSKLQHHIEHCEDRRKLDSFLYISDDMTKTENYYHIELPQSNENWDEDVIDHGSYLDFKDELLEKQRLFQVPAGLSKSEKKKFSKEQVKKFGALP